MLAESPFIVNKHSIGIYGGLRSRTKTALVWLRGWVLSLLGEEWLCLSLFKSKL
jgi:hypothetical protein